jgi:CubicO group peptidase (beta-lactamase class C family)
MGFQILAYAVENITGIAFPDLVVQELIEPLELHRTYVTNPGNVSDAVKYIGWDLDFGDEAP